MKKKRNPVPLPYRKWITPKVWKQIPEDRRIAMIELIKFQKEMQTKYKSFTSDEEYQNMNAEIEYLKSIGEH